MRVAAIVAKGVSIFLVGSISLLEMYSRVPKLFGEQISLELTSSSSSLHVLFPGFGGPDKNTERIVDKLNKNSVSNDDYSYTYDWSPWRGNILQASFSGQRVGRAIGRQLADNDEIQNLHCIGISVGSFAADACIKGFEKQKAKKVQKQQCNTVLTLLCPFQQRGLLGAGYGTKKFGKSAGYAEQYYITDDPVPGCNTPLQQAYCLDITQAKERDSYVNLPGDSVHAFPPYYYGKVVAGSFSWGKNNAERHVIDNPRGTVQQLLGAVKNLNRDRESVLPST